MYYTPRLRTPTLLTKIRIGLIDDHRLLRDSLINIINESSDFEVIMRADNGKDMIEQFETCSIPDIIILDLNMPLMDGYDTARWLQIHYPEINILVLSMFDSEVTLIRLLQIGVKAFLKKDTHPSELQHALKAIMAEGYYYPQTVSGRLANVFHNPDKGVFIEPLTLTQNEINFLRFICSDLTYKEIALQMNISPRTIDNYRDQLFGKLQIKSRVGLAMFAIKNGITNL